MKHEYVAIIIVGLLVFAYVLDAVVNPLNITLATPYHFFDPTFLSKYVFTTTSIVIKGIALFITPLWIFSYIRLNKVTKGAILFVLSALMQLYALQDVASNAKVIPLEWSISLALAGALLLIPSVLFIIIGFFQKATTDPYAGATTEEATEDL